MKRLLGLLLIVVSIGGGLYLGGWLCLCVPIVDGINAIMRAAVTTKEFAFILFKIFICTPLIEIIAIFLCSVGVDMLVFD